MSYAYALHKVDEEWPFSTVDQAYQDIKKHYEVQLHEVGQSMVEYKRRWNHNIEAEKCTRECTQRPEYSIHNFVFQSTEFKVEALYD